MTIQKFQFILVCVGIPIIILYEMGVINIEFDDANQKAVKKDISKMCMSMSHDINRWKDFDHDDLRMFDG